MNCPSIRNVSRLLLLVLSLMVFSACNKLEKQTLEQIDKLDVQEFSTVEYTFNKVIKASDDQTWYKMGDRKIVFTAKATVKAGLRLDNFSAKDVIIDARNKAITVNLPQPEILSISMRPEDIREVWHHSSFLRQNFSAEEKEDLFRQGLDDIKKDIPNTGILDDARNNAALDMTNFFKQLGYEKVTINFKENQNEHGRR